jgi:hypothetical protein
LKVDQSGIVIVIPMVDPQVDPITTIIRAPEFSGMTTLSQIRLPALRLLRATGLSSELPSRISYFWFGAAEALLSKLRAGGARDRHRTVQIRTVNCGFRALTGRF